MLSCQKFLLTAILPTISAHRYTTNSLCPPLNWQQSLLTADCQHSLLTAIQPTISAHRYIANNFCSPLNGPQSLSIAKLPIVSAHGYIANNLCSQITVNTLCSSLYCQRSAHRFTAHSRHCSPFYFKLSLFNSFLLPLYCNSSPLYCQHSLLTILLSAVTAYRYTVST